MCSVQLKLTIRQFWKSGWSNERTKPITAPALPGRGRKIPAFAFWDRIRPGCEFVAFVIFLTYRFDLALHLASGLHHNQGRKQTSIPYISHLLSVTALVLENGGTEDQAIAALLHDAVEDQGGQPTLDTIRQLFGNRVADIVRECSDSDATDPAQKLPSFERKRAYLRHLTSISNEALLVTLADKVHNARSILADYQQIGDQIWSRFNVGKEEQLAYYSGLLEICRQRATPTRLIDEFGRVVGELKRLASSGG